MHSPIYSQTCTGTYTFTTAQTRLKNTCPHTTYTHMYTCSLSHKCTITYTSTDLVHALTRSLNHSLTHIFSLSLTLTLFVTSMPIQAHSHMLIHYLRSHTITFRLIYGLTRSCALLILISHTYTHTRACTHALMHALTHTYRVYVHV